MLIRLAVGMTEMASADLRSIAERIDQRLASMAEHEAAIRADLEALASLTLPAADDHLLDVAAAASWLGVSRATMFRLIRNDPLLRHVKVGTRTLFRPEDLRSYAARLVAS
jgi:excisionase family DNA binding protein